MTSSQIVMSNNNMSTGNIFPIKLSVRMEFVALI
jgi:hypothetical protein